MLEKALPPTKKPFSFLLAFVATTCLLGFGATTVCAQNQGTQQFTTTINGATIAYSITGASGTPILLIHGYPLNGDLFEKQRQALSASYEVITMDVRGFGNSVAPDTQGTYDLYASDALALLDYLNIPQAIIGGHSMGGGIVTRLYQLAPTRFLGLILNDAAVMPPPTVEQNMWRGYQRQATEMGANVLFLPLLLPEFLTGHTRATRPALVVKVSNQVRAASLNGLIGGAHALETRPDLRPVFPTITVPTLILYGQEDSLTPMEQAQMISSEIPGSTLAIIPGASHGVIREAAGQANAVIASWLSSNFGTATITSQAAKNADID